MSNQSKRLRDINKIKKRSKDMNKSNKEIIEELGIADRPLIEAKTGKTMGE